MAVLELRTLALDYFVLEAVAGAVLGDQIEEVLRKIMRVNVDRCVVAHRGSGARLYLGGDRRTYNEPLESREGRGNGRAGQLCVGPIEARGHPSPARCGTGGAARSLSRTARIRQQQG